MYCNTIAHPLCRLIFAWVERQYEGPGFCVKANDTTRMVAVKGDSSAPQWWPCMRVQELLLCEANLPEYLANERTGKVPARMIWLCCCTSVRMAIEDMRSLLPNGKEAQTDKHFLHCLEVDNGKARHAPTSIC